MTDYGELSTGYRGKTFDEIGADVRSRLRSRIDPNLTLDEKDPLGVFVDVVGDELALAWEALEVARNQFDRDNAEGQGAIALAAVTGTARRQPTKGLAICTVNLDASKTFAPGALIAHVNGEPTNRWVNRDTITSTTAGNYTGKYFISETAGYYPAAVSTITKIAVTASGWNSITNTSAATPGQELETIPDLLARSEDELGSQGTGTLAGVRNAVLAVTGVIDCLVNYNDTTVTVGSLAPNQLEVVVWDGTTPLAANNEIAQAILDNKSAGAALLGSTTGNATDLYGAVKSVAFNRATYTNCYCSLNLLVKAGTLTVAIDVPIKQAIINAWPGSIGATVYANQLIVALAGFDAVVNVTAITVGLSASPVGSTIAAAANTIRLIPLSNIVVNYSTI